MSKVTYTAGGQIYLSDEGRMVYEGETFTADAEAPIGNNWLDEDGKPIPDSKKVAKPARQAVTASKAADDASSIDTAQIAEVLSASLAAAAEASATQMADLVEALRASAAPAAPAAPVDLYGKLSLAELKALAGVRKISVTGKSEAELADALRAADADA